MRNLPFLVFLLLSTASSGAENPQDLFQKRRAACWGFKGDFSQTVQNQAFGTERKTEGQFAFLNPDNRFRWESREVPGRFFIGQERQLWIVDRGAKGTIEAVMRDDQFRVNQSPLALLLVRKDRPLAKDFKVIPIPKVPLGFELVLKKAEEGVASIVIQLASDPKKFIASLTLKDALGNRTELAFSNQTVYDRAQFSRLPSSEKASWERLFQFQPPKGVEVREVRAARL